MVHRAGLAILRQQCGQWGDSHRSIPWRCFALPVGSIGEQTWDMQADMRFQLCVSALGKAIMKTCRHIRAELACYEHKRQASLQTRPPPQSGAGNAVANHPQGQEQQSMRLVAGGLQPRAAALQHHVAGGSIVESVPQCSSGEGAAAGRTAVTRWHPPRAALRRAVHLGRRHRNPQAPARTAAGQLARQQHAAPIGRDGYRPAPRLVRCNHWQSTSKAPALLRNGWSDFSITSSPGRKTV